MREVPTLHLALLICAAGAVKDDRRPMLRGGADLLVDVDERLAGWAALQLRLPRPEALPASVNGAGRRRKGQARGEEKERRAQ
jgi:hypothetical protein